MTKRKTNQANTIPMKITNVNMRGVRIVDCKPKFGLQLAKFNIGFIKSY